MYAEKGKEGGSILKVHVEKWWSSEVGAAGARLTSKTAG